MQRLDDTLQRTKHAICFRLQESFEGAITKESKNQSEVDAFMEHYAKRWQTRECTYQLKPRLKPDVRDLPKEISADVDG